MKSEWFMGTVAGVIAITAVVVGTAYGKISHSPTHKQLIAWGAAIVVVVAGTFALRHVSTALGRLLSRRSSLGAGATLRLVVEGIGYLVLVFALLGVLGVSLQQLLIGAGLAGVILGIAAQQSLGNIFASIVLLFARPFVVGEDIRIRSGVVGVLDVKVLGIGLTYVTVRTDDGILKIPNSVILSSGIGKPRQILDAPVDHDGPASAEPTNEAN
jgi:small-conductance mechanosensitive channel